MASITSAISLFVLLLATYCYSVPIGTEFEFTTVESERIHGERDSVPVFPETFEETTIVPHTVERDSVPVFPETFEETTIVPHIVERDSVPVLSELFEETTVVPHIHVKRTKVVDDKDIDSDELTTGRTLVTGDKLDKRTSEVEGTLFDVATTAEIIKDDIEADLSKKREDTSFTFDITTSEIPSEDSKVVRSFDSDLVTPLELSTEFNERASRFVEGEPILSGFTEPTSSFETLAQSTGLLKTRTIPEKIEGTFEENFTTVEPHH